MELCLHFWAIVTERSFLVPQTSSSTLPPKSVFFSGFSPLPLIYRVVCSVFFEILKTITKSGHIFCGECITSALEFNPVCPECRAPCSVDKLNTSAWLSREVLTLRVRCPTHPIETPKKKKKHKPVCEWEGSLNELIRDRGHLWNCK